MKKYLLICMILIGITSGYSQLRFLPQRTILPTDSTFSESVRTADMNNDGINDVIRGIGKTSSSTEKYGIQINYLNRDNTVDSFYNVKYSNYINGIAYGFNTGDINNDGKTDIVVYSQTDTVFILKQQSPSVYSKTFEIFTTQYGAIEQAIISDINNDSKNDIILIPFNNNLTNSGILFIMYQTVSGFANFVYQLHDGWRGYFWDAEVGDINNDQKNDVVLIRNQFYGNDSTFVTIIPQLDDGTLGSSVSYLNDSHGFGPRRISIGDINNDSKNEIITGGYNTWDTTQNAIQPIRIWSQQSHGFIKTNEFMPYDITDRLYFLETSDMDCDNKEEILYESYNTHLAIAKISPTNIPSFTTMSILPPSYGGRRSIALNDMNNDGAKDIVLAQGEGVVSIVENQSYSCLKPIIIDFNAIKQNQTTALLTWSVKNSLYIEQYIVERSTDNLVWTTMESLAFTNNLTYDNNPINGWNYYRLKVVTPVENIYSVPVKLYFTLGKIWTADKTIYSSILGATDYVLFASDGKMLKKGSFQNQLRCDFLPTGIYILHANNINYKIML